ncbi:MAG: methionine synthase, partial [Firmicutes bacterium]|nr:methionine synthase [Bacillota bacterium]
MPDSINREEWSRLLGMDIKSLSEADAHACEQQLLEVARPQGFFVYSDKIDFEGESIKKHLAGSERVIIMGVTLGRSVDDLIFRLEVKDMKKAVFADTGASVLADMVADELEKEIREGLPEETPYMTGRFSPGYGDLPLGTQRDLIRALDAERKIGLTLNENNLMIPMKSVTAIIGISSKPVTGFLATCDKCVLYSKCEKRKEGRICG